MQFFSQAGQDRFLFEKFFYGKRDGVFVDIGAYDGEKFSNTLFFERFLGWRGLCIEPLSSAFTKLITKRKAICQQICVADFEGEEEFTEVEATVNERMLGGLTRYLHPQQVQRLQSLAGRTVTHIVPVTTLSCLLDMHSLPQVDYCSIDTGARSSTFSPLSTLTNFRFRCLRLKTNTITSALLI
jgi:FkbM family methyltransferase